MKLKIVLLALIGAAGATSSFALADSGHGRGHTDGKKDQACKRAVVFGTAAAPQSFTVTVTHANRHSTFQKGDVVTVSLGAQGQTVAVTGFGCSDGSTLQAGTALLRVRMAEPPHTTTAVTTTGDNGKGHHHPGGSTTTSNTTTSDTTTSDSTTSDSTTSDSTTSTSTSTE
jgi:hypothetical protein